MKLPRWTMAMAGLGALIPGAFASSGLYGYCTTSIGTDRVCTDIVAISPQDSLLERCAPWARWIDGKGWSYRNSRDQDDLRENHQRECRRVVPLDSGVPHQCWAVVLCPAAEAPRSERSLDVVMRAFSPQDARQRCAKAASPKITELLVALGNPDSAECFLKLEARP